MSLGRIHVGICSIKKPYGMVGNHLQLANFIDNVGVRSRYPLHTSEVQ